MNERQDVRRQVWTPQFDCEVVEVLGRDWPDIYVQKWEENGIGERRFVDGRFAHVQPRPAWSETPYRHAYVHAGPQDCRDYEQCHGRAYGSGDIA